MPQATYFWAYVRSILVVEISIWEKVISGNPIWEIIKNSVIFLQKLIIDMLNLIQ